MVEFKFPCDVGDIVYVIKGGFRIPAHRLVRSISIRKDSDNKYEVRFSLLNVRTDEVSIVKLEDFDNTVFTDSEVAMKMLSMTNDTRKEKA